MISLIIGAILVGSSAYLFTKKYFKEYSLADFYLIWFTLFFAQIILVQLSLGIINKFYFHHVFLLELLIFLLAFFFCYNKKTIIIQKPSLENFLGSNLLVIVCSIFLAFFIVKFIVNLVNPPMYPDSMQFGLAFPASWIVSGNLDNPFQIFGSVPMLNPHGFETSSGSYYPINALLFFSWLMMPLKNAFLADVGEVPFYLMGIITIYSILKKYKVHNVLALLSGFLWVLIPNVLKQLRNGAQYDVVCAALFLLVVNSFLLLKDNFRFRNGLIFGISIGLFIGTKVTNLLWLVSLLPFISFSLFKELKFKKIRLLKILEVFFPVALMIILFGGYIYLKNYIYTGNPLFPYNVKIFGKLIFKGILDNAEYKMQVAAWGFDFKRILFKEGLGFQFLALILPATFLPALFIGFMKRKFTPISEYALLFLTPLFMLTLYFALINVCTTRYFYSYLSLGLIVAVIFVTKFSWGKRYLTSVVVISVLMSAFKLANGQELVIAIIFAIFLSAAIIFYKRGILIFYNSKYFYKYVLGILLLVSLFFMYLNREYDREEFNRYSLTLSKKEKWQVDITRGWKALNEVTGSGARVAYTGRQEFYPFYGTKLKNYVTYISINKKEITPYNDPDGLYRRIKNYPAWRENLKKENINYLFVAQPFFNNRESEDPKKFPIEDEWAVANPEEFSLVFSNSMARIYRVLIK